MNECNKCEKLRLYAMSYIIGISTPESAMDLICSALFGEDYMKEYEPDIEMFKKIIKNGQELREKQQDLDPESKKALYENLWDLYE